MRCAFAAVLALTCPAAGSAQDLAGAQATVQAAAYDGAATEAPFRLNGDLMLRFGEAGLQIGATYGAQDLTDLHLIGFRDIGPRWRIGAEIATSNDPAFAGGDLIWGLRLRYSDAGGTIDTRGGLVHNGPDGAFFVTVSMAQNLSDTISVRGMLHRYSTNPEAGDFFAIGLGGDVSLSETWSVYADGIWALNDDYSKETTGGTLGLRRAIGPSQTLFAGLSGYAVNGDVSAGVTAGLSLSLDRPGTGALFNTDPWQMQLAQIGH